MPRFDQMTADQKAKYVDNLNVLQSVPPAARALVAQEAIDSQKKIVPQIYYSTVLFGVTKTGGGGGPYTVTCAQQDRKAFVYKEGDDMTAAGFTTTSATRAETNLTSGGSQTNDNADVVVWGIGLEFPDSGPAGDGEIELLKALLTVTWIEFQLNSNNRFLLGKMQDFPAGGGLYGQAPSKLRAGPIADERGAVEGMSVNGNPMAGNFWKLPIPFRWNAVGSGKADTSLAMTFKMSGAVALTTSADRAAGTGVAGFTVGDAAQLAQRVRVKLATIEIGQRSYNA